MVVVALLAGIALPDAASAAPPTITIRDVAIKEGRAGLRRVAIRVRLSAPTARAVVLRYGTLDRSRRVRARAAAKVDYVPVHGVMRIRAHRRVGRIIVFVRGDRLNEADESFLVKLYGAARARIRDRQAAVRVMDDDPPPEIAISGVTVAEGDESGEQRAVFVIKLSSPSALEVDVNLATAPGTAVSPDDYEYVAGTVRFLPGETIKRVSVPIAGDPLDEDDEFFFAALSKPIHGMIVDGQGKGTILDDDEEPSLLVDDVRVLEGDNGTVSATFVVRLSAASGRKVSVDFLTADGTARAPEDYASAAARLSLSPGQTTLLATVTVNGDAFIEPDETFFAELSNAANATIADGEGLATIADDDALGALLPPPLAESTGAAFFVSPTGSDENPGTESEPWQTVQKAVDSLQPGQRAYVQQGIYTENVVYDPTTGHGAYGTSADPITVTNYPGDSPVLRPSATSPRYPLRLKGAYFRFHGFVIEEAPAGSRFVNVYITGASNGAPAHHLELSGCDIRFARSASGMFVDYTANHVQILGNYVHDNNELGVQHQGIYLEADDSLIANNVTYNQTNGFGIQVRTDASTGPRGVIVASNTTAHNSYAGIVIEHTAIDAKIVNNITAYNLGSGILGHFSLDHLEDPIGTGNEAWSNMAYLNNPNFRTERPPILSFHDNVVADPLFVSLLLRDYHLLPGSPALGSGIAAWTPPTNIEGEPRTLPPSLGAY
jgi:hypothetical protein